LLQPGQLQHYSDDGRWRWDGQRWVPVGQSAISGSETGPFVQYAGFWLRFVAYLIDGVILFIGELVIFFLFGILGAAADAFSSGLTGSSGSTGVSFAGQVASLLAWAIVLAGTWLYFSLQESSARQATIGKAAMGIKVTDLEGTRMSFGRATGRYFAKFLSGLICDIGFAMAGFTERKQGLHDMVAGTLVVRTRPDPGRQLQPGAGSGPSGSAIAVSVVAAVAILVLTSLVVIVILLTMGGQIKNVFSNVTVALNS
jgi:uncharacterized RDD family membrane protein YckC